MSIPLSLVAAGLVLHACGATINVMVLAGFVIALGVVVDDAIIDIENICAACVSTGEPAAEVDGARSSSRPRSRCGAPIVYATLIILAALAPVFFLHSLTEPSSGHSSSPTGWRCWRRSWSR